MQTDIMTPNGAPVRARARKAKRGGYWGEVYAGDKLLCGIGSFSNRRDAIAAAMALHAKDLVQ